MPPNATAEDATLNSTDNSVPTDKWGHQIKWTDNPAHLPGLLKEVMDFYERTQQHQMLFKHRAAVSGKYLAVESLITVQFVLGETADGVDDSTGVGGGPHLAGAHRVEDRGANPASSIR